MKNSLFPVALGIAASLSVPLQAGATEPTTTETEQRAEAELPVEADTDSVTPMETTSTSADMPVSQPSYTESSGALTFEPSQMQSHPPQTPATPASAQPESPLAARPTVPASPPPVKREFDGNSSQPPAVKRDFGGVKSSNSDPDDLFEGGSESLVARTVGAAEGTRTADGGKTQNYHGHVDPGNGVWNRGTFSYQFGNTENLSADEADRRQLAKIKRIYESVMLPKAEQHGVAPLSIEEEINGIDLINQAPLTVTEEGGYIERLAEAKQKGLMGEEAILNARIWSFWDNSRGGWDAPGLRAYDDISKEESIRRDQDRRMGMIAKALAAYERENGDIARRPTTSPKADSMTAMSDRKKSAPQQEVQTKDTIADAIIFGGKPATRG